MDIKNTKILNARGQFFFNFLKSNNVATFEEHTNLSIQLRQIFLMNHDLMLRLLVTSKTTSK